jgi:hypothetical protein
MYTDPWLPPPLYPGTGGDAAWCTPAPAPCPTACDVNASRRRYGSKDYIEINANVRKTFLRLMSNSYAPSHVLPNSLPVYIEIRKRGNEALVARYDAFQRTLDGDVGFYWDSLFNEAPPGLYVGDVVVDCCYCFSVLFRIRPCEMVVGSYHNELATESCGMGECSMLDTIGEGVIGGLQCEVAPEPSECGLPAPYFESTDPVPNSPICELTCDSDLSCEPAWRKPPDELSDCSTPVFSVTGDVLIGDI